MNARGLNVNAWANAAGASESAIRGFLAGRTQSLNTSTYTRLAEAAGVPVSDLLPNTISSASEGNAQKAGNEKRKKILEVDVYGGMGGGGIAAFHNHTDSDGNTVAADDIRATWELPQDYISELRIAPGKARIIEVQGDSMEPTLRTGDRVMINTADKRPSPPGIFAVWDGFGVVVKRIEPIPNSDPPTLRIISDNGYHSAYERTVEEVSIIGRVIWFSRKI